MKERFLQVEELGKLFTGSHGEISAFQDISFHIPQGQFCALVGPSGCGKTTLLRCLAGLEVPSHGHFSISESDKGTDASISMVFQEKDLFPWMNLKKNLSFILQNNSKFANRDVNAIAETFLAKVGLTKFSGHFPSQISGGMQQRLSLARSFASEPDLLLMDEPFVYLDYQSRLVLHELLLDIWQTNGNTVLFVTHDIEEAVFLADRVLVMSAHPGRLIHDVSCDFPRPRKLEDMRTDSVYIEKVNQLTRWIREEMKDQFV